MYLGVSSGNSLSGKKGKVKFTKINKFKYFCYDDTESCVSFNRILPQ